MKHLKYLLIAGCLLFASYAYAAVGTIYVDTGGSATNSGTTDTNAATFSGTAANWTTGTATINLDTNTNLTGLSTAGDQAIFLTNATNSNQKIFWITGITGCTGSGACSVTASINVTCTTCTAQNWAIGGRYLSPSGATAEATVKGALRAGDTVLYNNDPAAKSINFITSNGVAGDVTTGPITIKGKSGSGTGTCPGTSGSTVACPKLVISSGSANAIQILVANWTVDTLDLENSGTGFSILGGMHTVVKNNRVAGGTNALSLGGNGAVVENNEVTGSTGDCITGGFVNYYIEGNYVHGCTGNGMTFSSTSVGLTIYKNLITGNSKGISFSGITTSQSQSPLLVGNVIYGNSSDGLFAANANTSMVLQNNIFQDNGQTSGYNVNLASNGGLAVVHANNVYYQSGAGTPTGNLNNLTLGGSEFTTSPAFVNAAGSNFAVGATGSAYQAGTPLTWGSASTTSYPNIGAAASQPGTISGGASAMLGGGF